MLKGNLSGFSLGEILQSLALNNHTGTLMISRHGSPTKHIYFENGEIKYFSHGTPKTPRIGEILIQGGRLTQDQLSAALEEAHESKKLLGTVLVETGLVSEEDIHKVLAFKIREEMYDLFTYTDGEFEFELNQCPEEIFDAFQRSICITINTNSVIMEGLRRLDEWSLIQSTISTENEVFVVTDQGPAEEDDKLTNVVLSLVDGKTPVREMLKKYRGIRFDFFKRLYELIQANRVRPLNLNELQAAAVQHKKDRRYAETIACLRFACELSPGDPQILMDLGDVLTKFYQENEAKDVYIQALKALFDQGDWKGIADLSEKLPPNTNLDPVDLQLLLQAFIELKLLKKALWVGNLLATSLQRKGETQQAAEVLDSLIELDPSDLNLKVQIATLFQQVGETQKATDYYEEVVEALDSKERIKDQIKILRLVADLNPKRTEVKQRIATLVALQEKLERQRKRRLTIAGVSIIALLIFSVIPLVYELKARELYSHAERLNQYALSSTADFTQAKAAYERLLESYPMSSVAHGAKLALDRIADTERNILTPIKKKGEEWKEAAEEKRKQIMASVDSTLEKAKMAEADGRFEEAHEHLEKALELSKGSLKVIQISYPLLIESSPSGATIEVDGEFIGKTPAKYKYSRGDEVTFKLTLRGCEEFSKTEVLDKQHKLVFDLPRRSVAEYVLPSTFDQNSHETGLGNTIVFPSQDGHLYAYDTGSGSVAWQRRVGKFGDRISNLHVRDGVVYVGTVDNSVFALHSKTGKTKWVANQIRGPFHAAPATSEDSRWLAVANLYGDVFILDNHTGDQLSDFETENEITASPVFINGSVLVGSTDSHLYGYDVEQKKIQFIAELSSEIELDPVTQSGSAFFATTDGRLHKFSMPLRRRSWSTRITEEIILSLAVTDTQILAAISSGQVIAVDPKKGTVENHWEISKSMPGGMKSDGDILYVGYENGLLAAWDMKENQLAWSWQADAAIDTAPLTIDDKLYVACSSGILQVLEIIK